MDKTDQNAIDRSDLELSRKERTSCEQHQWLQVHARLVIMIKKILYPLTLALFLTQILELSAASSHTLSCVTQEIINQCTLSCFCTLFSSCFISMAKVSGLSSLVLLGLIWNVPVVSSCWYMNFTPILLEPIDMCKIDSLYQVQVHRQILFTLRCDSLFPD